MRQAKLPLAFSLTTGRLPKVPINATRITSGRKYSTRLTNRDISGAASCSPNHGCRLRAVVIPADAATTTAAAAMRMIRKAVARRSSLYSVRKTMMVCFTGYS